MVYSCPSEFITLAHQLADAARPIGTQYFRTDLLEVENKPDHTPVTIADRLIEETWRKMVEHARPQDAIWGEEFGRSNENAELTWIFDPIDGTKAFTLGRATFGCLIGLHHKTHGFILGIVDQPVLGLRWVGARGHGAQLNGKPLESRHAALNQIRVCLTDPMRLTPDLQALQHQLLKEVAFFYYGGDCMNYVGLADGSLHLNFDSQQAIYDIAAAIPIIEGAGGVITHKDGSAIDLTANHTILAACTPQLHADMLARLQKIDL